jgi:RNA polymerase sigma factor (sigma-70 family)
VQELTAQEILSGLRDKNGKVLDFIYENHYYRIQNFVTRNSGTGEDAQDVFQDAILVIFQKLQKEEIILDCSFGTYLYSICRLLWLKQLKKKSQTKAFIEESEETVKLDDSLDVIHDKNERYNLYLKHFNKLSYNCQKILELFLARISSKEIARVLGLKSEQYVKKRKHICKEKLVESIKNDPNYTYYMNKNNFHKLKKL